MRGFIKEKFGLTDTGAKAVELASIISFFVNMGYMAFMMIAMYFGKNMLDGASKPALHYLMIVGIVTVLVFLIVDLEYIKTFNSTYKEAADLRLELADRLKKLPLSYFSRHDLSDLAQTIMQDVLDIEHAMSHAMPRCIGYGGFLAVVIVLLLISNLKLGIATALPLIIGFLMMYMSKGMQKKWTNKYFWKTRENSETFQETIELQREIKSYGLADEKYENVSKALDRLEKLRMRSEITQATPMILSLTFLKITLGVIAVVSAGLMKANQIELIFVIGYILASVRLVDAVGALEESFAELLYLDARVKRLNEIRGIELQSGRAAELEHFDITLEHVSFGYLDNVNVVNDVSFTAKQNEVTAIVGPSGCGKSTILRLISRLFDYDAGKILIDGNEINDISTDALFDKISFVFQDVVLFNASVMDNIRIGRKDASDEEVREAARLANCEEIINKLPDGYDTMIGENGSNLSGGERQRISIARAFLKNAPILLLDEISASLDVENERKIQESLNLLIRNKTVIIVSHRLKSIEKADKIIVMNSGKIDAAGAHETLLENSELYRRLIEKSDMTDSFVY